MPLYLADCIEELHTLGEFGFAARYPSPMLIVQSFAGKLREGGGAGGTLVSEKPFDDVRQASQLIGRAFVVKKGAHSAPGPISLGRTADNDIAVPEYSISKRHCLIRIDATGATLTDLGSTNGTLLDGLPVPAKKPLPIKDGSVITLGRFAFAYYSPLGFLNLVKSQA